MQRTHINKPESGPDKRKINLTKDYETVKRDTSFKMGLKLDYQVTKRTMSQRLVDII
jgi:hypothetical protein